ncbi:hypothetical protein [Winogradskyella sp.]|uniref:hypothetical protein n=1 Tax=Winogradskyella sp. TaxID=1883156 RepID=UPI001B0C0AD8|nr:hypothetical protein [Winogradskyella sp.]MBO6880437.1 hypothetical protein [Winogradskyella sp.]
MTQNYILVNTKDQSGLENVLFDLAELYSDTIFAHGIRLYRRKEQTDSFLICFENNPDFNRFSFFTNYIEYPIDRPNFKAKVRGYYQTRDLTTDPQLNTGEWLMLYINPNDEHGDNVYVVNENHQNSIWDFGGRHKKLSRIIEEFKMHSITLEDYHNIIDIYPTKNNLKAAKSESPLWKKIKAISAILICLAFTLGGIWLYDGPSKNVALGTIIFFGLGFIVLLWQFLNPKAFQKNNE